jgi:hypothetical protein
VPVGPQRTGFIGLGGWISPKTALTVRVAGTSFVEDDIQYIAGMLGLSAQHMVTEAAWLGGGLGIGVLTTDIEGDEGLRGLGLDLRAGYNFHQSARNAFSVSVEVTPLFVEDFQTCLTPLPSRSSSPYSTSDSRPPGSVAPRTTLSTIPGAGDGRHALGRQEQRPRRLHQDSKAHIKDQMVAAVDAYRVHGSMGKIGGSIDNWGSAAKPPGYKDPQAGQRPRARS